LGGDAEALAFGAHSHAAEMALAALSVCSDGSDDSILGRSSDEDGHARETAVEGFRRENCVGERGRGVGAAERCERFVET
jgi:hypothetical protein